jgi:predicted transcriptional regulator
MLPRVMDFRKARLFLELRQTDVADATGLPVSKIAAAERGESLHPHDRGVLERFLAAQLQDELECSEGHREIRADSAN